MNVGEVWEYELRGNLGGQGPLGLTNTAYIMVTYNRGTTIRGILLSMRTEYLAKGDILVPKEESRLKKPFMLCTWADIEIDPTRLLKNKYIKLHRDHVNSALMLLQSKFTPKEIKIEKSHMLFETVDTVVNGQYYVAYVPYWFSRISDPLTKRRGKIVSATAFLGAEDFDELYSAQSMDGKLQRKAMQWRRDMLSALH